MKDEKKQILKSTIVPFIFATIMFIFMLYQWIFNKSLYFLGIHPLKLDGIYGIVTSIFIHQNWQHLFSNLLPFIIFTSALYYYYPKVANKIFIGLWLTSGLYLWLFARDNWHIGASGLIYALAFFHIVSAIIEKEIKLIAFSMLIVFLYGSMIWGFFPEMFPKENISWQGHFMGALTGVVFAVFFSKYAPKSKKYFEDEIDDEENFENVE